MCLSSNSAATMVANGEGEFPSCKNDAAMSSAISFKIRADAFFFDWPSELQASSKASNFRSLSDTAMASDHADANRVSENCLLNLLAGPAFAFTKDFCSPAASPAAQAFTIFALALFRNFSSAR